MNVEAAAVLDIYTWKDTGAAPSEAAVAYTAEELADVLIDAFAICAKLNLDPLKLMQAKQQINDSRHRAQKP